MQENTEIGYNSKIEGDVIHTRVDAALNWFRKNSIWPMPMGLACCAIELMATGASRFDISRFGMEVMRFSPRQSDCMVVAGTVTYKMAMAVKRIYDQMAEPKWVIAMGACTVGGGPYFKWGYHVVKGVDLVVPVDVYVPGCPPRPEALLEGLMRIQDKIRGHKMAKRKTGEGVGHWLSTAGSVGPKVDDELPIPHHSGYVEPAVEGPEPLYDHQKITG